MTAQTEIAWDVCERKHGGNQESRDAFASIAPQLSKRAIEVYNHIVDSGAIGMTSRDLGIVLGLPDQPKPKNEFSGRISDLLKLGKIERKQIGTDLDGSPIWHRRIGCAVFYAKGAAQ